MGFPRRFLSCLPGQGGAPEPGVNIAVMLEPHTREYFAPFCLLDADDNFFLGRKGNEDTGRKRTGISQTSRA
jgi:hypothetical protein